MMKVWPLALILLTACNEIKQAAKVVEGRNANYSGDDTDPLHIYQWHLHNSGQTGFTSTAGTPGMDIRLGSVHDHYRGRDVRIVVSDTSVDFSHEDLTDNADLSNSRDYLRSTPWVGDPGPRDNQDSHGTSVTGIVGAARGNGKGGFGVAPLARLIGTNFLSSSIALSMWIDQASIPEAQIYNYSYGHPNCSVTPASSSLVNTFRNNAHFQNSVFISSGGNDFVGSHASCGMVGFYRGNANLDQFKSYPYLINVASSTYQGNWASYSTPGANVWITAPGGDREVGILSPDLEGCQRGQARESAGGVFDSNRNQLNPDCKYTSMPVGTSFASPIVAGAVGILREVDPGLSWRDIKHILASTATRLRSTDAGWISNRGGYRFHHHLGFGQLNLTAAVEMAKAKSFNLHQAKYTINDLSGESGYTSGPLNRAIPDNNTTGVSSAINVNRHDLWIEHVQVKINVDHPVAQDLAVRLTSPAGTSSWLMLSRSNILDNGLYEVTLGANAFYGERSLGNWTLQVSDEDAEDVGVLRDWSIKILGNKGPTDPAATPPAPVIGLSVDQNIISWNQPTRPVLRFEGCVVADLGSMTEPCSELDWINLGNTNSTEFNYYDGRNGHSIRMNNNYIVRIRAIDSSENESTIEEISWRAR
jgi:subtilisin-like proprotein convertase family protein